MTYSTAPIPRTPTSLAVARVCGIVQGGVAAVFTALATAYAIGSFVADRSAARAGNPDGWAGFGEGLGAVAAVLGLAAGLLVAVPAARLRADRPAARTALVVGEILTGVPLGLLWVAAVLAERQQLAVAATSVWTVCSVVAVVALAVPLRPRTPVSAAAARFPAPPARDAHR